MRIAPCVMVGMVLFLSAFTPIYVQHDTQEKVDVEFKNSYDQTQPNQFRVFSSTPGLQELKDNEVVIFSSNTVVKILFRNLQEVYAVNASCVTVRR